MTQPDKADQPATPEQVPPDFEAKLRSSAKLRKEYEQRVEKADTGLDKTEAEMIARKLEADKKAGKL